MSFTDTKTVFGSLDSYVKGGIEVIDDDRRHYAFSNVFEVASLAKPYEKVVVGKNLRYVIETLRAEGTSDWFTASHDESVIVMDGSVEIDLVKLDDPERIAPAHIEGSIRLEAPPQGRRMGLMKLRRGHQALLPKGAAYRFRSTDGVGVLVLQTIHGPHSVEKWSEICLT
ncbi:MAG: hydroxyquinol 1,2-dioxygenase [Gammaproteobacteria bacterium]|nr:hydroxyquinol 1,2-dioxygenase [Gammaproteobacteria bacterium]